MSRLYTTADLKVLRDSSIEEASRILNRPASALRAAKRRYFGGRPHRKFWAEDIASMMEMQTVGVSLVKIARTFDTTVLSLKQHLHRARLHGFGAYPLKGE